MATKNKNILGIDTGSTTIGYGVVSYNKTPHNPTLVDFGYIDLKKHKDDNQKLLHLYKDIKEIFKQFKPYNLAIENVYFFKNAKTISPVMQSKGVILLAAAEANIKTFEYPPLKIKQTISGNGRADKSLVAELVKSTLGIKSRIKPDDASDALAIALCHLRYLTIS